MAFEVDVGTWSGHRGGAAKRALLSLNSRLQGAAAALSLKPTDEALKAKEHHGAERTMSGSRSAGKGKEAYKGLRLQQNLLATAMPVCLG